MLRCTHKSYLKLNRRLETATTLKIFYLPTYTVALEMGETGKISPLPLERGGLGRGKTIFHRP